MDSIRMEAQSVGAIRNQVREYIESIIMPDLESRRALVNDMFMSQLTDEQWEQFLTYASKTAIPLLTVGKMRGYRLGIRKRMFSLRQEILSPDRALEVYLRDHQILMHDIIHVGVQRFRGAPITPAFLSGSRYEDMPMIDQEPGIRAPFDVRHVLSKQVIEDELFVTLFATQPIDLPASLVPEKDRKQGLRAYLSMAAFACEQHFVQQWKADIPTEQFRDGTQQAMVSQIREIAERSEYTVYDAFDVFLRMTCTYSEETLRTHLKKIYSEFDYYAYIEPIITEKALPLFDQVVQNPPRELYPLFEYVYEHTDEILYSLKPTLFELFMSLLEPKTQ